MPDGVNFLRRNPACSDYFIIRGIAGQEKTSPVTGRFSRFLQTVTLFETVNTSATVNKLLLASEKRMALAADFDRQFLFGGTGLEGLAASTANQRFAIFRMDILLHA
jgi:hypothetical protein